MGSLCTSPFQTTKAQWREGNGSLPPLSRLQVITHKMGPSYYIITYHVYIHVKSSLHVCMYVCMTSFCLEKSTFKMLDFYFSHLTHLQPNSILYPCINPSTYIYLLNNHLLFYLPTYLSTYKTYPLKAYNEIYFT
jgi:hypothetical protein